MLLSSAQSEKSRDICFGIVFFCLRSMLGIEDEEIEYQNDINIGTVMDEHDLGYQRF
jgi:hypothetical protein